MLKQDRTRLMERHAARAMQPSANVMSRELPVQQEVAEPRGRTPSSK